MPKRQKKKKFNNNLGLCICAIAHLKPTNHIWLQIEEPSSLRAHSNLDNKAQSAPSNPHTVINTHASKVILYNPSLLLLCGFQEGGGTLKRSTKKQKKRKRLLKRLKSEGKWKHGKSSVEKVRRRMESRRI
jgi:hypothetical protein